MSQWEYIMSVDDSDIKMQLFILFANTSSTGQKNSRQHGQDFIKLKLCI